MNRDDVITLAKAGFTRDQIAALYSIQPAAAPTPAFAPTAAPAFAPTPAPAFAPTQAPAADPLAAVLQRMDTLTGAIQANALLNTQQPAAQTVDDILAEIINPPKKEG